MRNLVPHTQEADHAFAGQVTPDPGAFSTCIQCGSCTASCPTVDFMDVTLQRLWRLIRLGLREEALESRAFWLCTSCGACNAHCPRGIPLLETMIGLKSHVVAKGIDVPEDLALLRDTLRATRNISGDPNENRLVWSQNLPQPIPSVTPRAGADILYFVGCVASFYPRAFSIPQALGRILTHADVSFTTLGGAEWCCGYPLFNAGLAAEAAELVTHNIEQVRRSGARVMVMTCPSCYYTWKNLYPRVAPLPPGLTIVHATQLLAEFLDAKRIRPGIASMVVTYHDPCDLGRKGGEVAAPRHILNVLPGVELVEMSSNREHGLCCGGGGDVKISSLDATMEAARRRLGQALVIDAGVVVSACQQCKRALVTAAQTARQPVKVVDIVELVWETLHNKVSW